MRSTHYRKKFQKGLVKFTLLPGKLKFNEEQYVNALRGDLNRPTVFLRSFSSVNINAYNCGTRLC
jgi:hypothetical protein